MKTLIEGGLKSTLLTAVLFICISILYGCAGKKPDLRAGMFRFKYMGEKYRIRSVTSVNDSLCFNDLIAANFLAKDYDQDGLIDDIIMGEVKMSEAQAIYEYALTMLARQNKLHSVPSKRNAYRHANSEYDYELKSFRPDLAEPFNEFKMIHRKKRTEPDEIICIDRQADGSIDSIVKGSMTLEKIQTYYSRVLQQGLKENRLSKTENRFLVKED